MIKVWILVFTLANGVTRTDMAPPDVCMQIVATLAAGRNVGVNTKLAGRWIRAHVVRAECRAIEAPEEIARAVS